MKTSFLLPSSVVSAAKSLAGESAQKYNFTKNAPYSRNGFKRHFIGKLGECGLCYSLKYMFPALEIVELFKYTDSHSDLVIKSKDESKKDLKIEIKCSTPFVWNLHHACINARQALTIQQKSDIVVYCTAHTGKNTLIIKGFNYTDSEHNDIKDSEIEVIEVKGVNITSHVMAERSPEELYELLHEYI